MPKAGSPLERVPGFTADVRSKLRDHLSVTTVEEFVDLAARYPAQVRGIVGAAAPEWQALVEAARHSLPGDVLVEITAPTRSSFSTGHDWPGGLERPRSRGDVDEEP